jgi:hypothetical protein
VPLVLLLTFQGVNGGCVDYNRFLWFRLFKLNDSISELDSTLNSSIYIRELFRLFALNRFFRFLEIKCVIEINLVLHVLVVHIWLL